MNTNSRSARKESVHKSNVEKQKPVVKALKTKSGVDEIPLLFPGPASWAMWWPCFQSYMQANFPLEGRCFKERRYRDFNVVDLSRIPEQDQTVTAAIRNKLISELYSINLKQQIDSDNEKAKMFGILEMTISAESKDVLESHEDYNHEMDVLNAFLILEKSHQDRNAFLSTKQRMHKVKMDYAIVRQMEHETLVDFRNRFQIQLNIYNDLLGIVRAIPEAESTMDFISKLDSSRYDRFQDQVKRWDDAQDVDKIPVSLSDAVYKANVICGSSTLAGAKRGVPTRGYTPAVFVAAADEGVQQKKDLSRVQCYNCQKMGHYKSNCPNKKISEHKKTINGNKSSAKTNSGARMNTVAVTAAVSKSLGRYSELQNESDDENNFVYLALSDEIVVVQADIRAYGAFSERSKSSTIVHSDSCANKSLFGNPNLLINIRESNHVYRVRTAQGVINVSTVGDLPGWGEVMYLEGAPNLIALRHTEDLFKSEYEPQLFFRARDRVTDDIIVTFACQKNRLYSVDWKTVQNCNVSYAVDTVSSRAERYSAQDRKAADVAREAVRILGFPTDGGLAYDIEHGGIVNNPVTVRGLRVAADIAGADVASMKGKATIPPAVQQSMLEVGTTTDRDHALYCDIFEIEGQQFLLSLVDPMGLLLVTHIKSRKAEKVYELLSSHVNALHDRGFAVKFIVVDPARELVALAHRGVNGVAVKLVGPGVHVQKAERAIRTIKERCRAVIHSLPWTLPYNLIPDCVYFVVIRLNQVARRSVGPVAPVVAFTGRKVDYSKDVRLGFGDYVQVKTRPLRSSSMEARTRGCICLYPAGTLTGTHVFYSLDKGSKVHADQWTALPTPDIVIREMNECAARQSHKAEETIRERAGASPVIGTNGHELIDDNLSGEVDGEDTHLSPPVRIVPTDVPAPTEITIVSDDRSMPVVEGNDHDEYVTDLISEEAETVVEEEIQETQVDSNLGDLNLRRSSRHRVAPKRTDFIALHISIKEAVKRYSEKADESAYDEMKQLWERNVFIPQMPDTISRWNGKQILRSFLFLKEKFATDGSLRRLKSRLVANGNMQDNVYKLDKSSPTVKLESVLMCFAIAAVERRSSVSIDIGNAFCEAEMTGEEEVFVELDKFCVMVLLKVAPQLSVFVSSNGRMVCRLNKALYGCVQSAKLWFEKIKGILVGLKFVQNAYDLCVFNNTFNGTQITVALYVDDMLATCTDKKIIDKLVMDLRGIFKEVKCSDFDKYEYLGFEVDGTGTDMKLTMVRYTRDMLSERVVAGKASSPARSNLFEIDDSSAPLDSEGKRLFHRHVAQALFLAKRFRFDILLAVNHLTSKVQSPTVQDNADLDRVYRYLSATTEAVLCFSKDAGLNPECFIDASFGVHDGGRSRTGVCMMMAGACVGAWTSKQGMVTKSSTEAELVGFVDGCVHALWVRHWLHAQGFPDNPMLVWQDNESTINILQSEQGPSQRTKHLNIRMFFGNEKIRGKELCVMHKSTGDMIADVLTKPLVGSQFNYLAGQLLGGLYGKTSEPTYSS